MKITFKQTIMQGIEANQTKDLPFAIALRYVRAGLADVFTPTTKSILKKQDEEAKKVIEQLPVKPKNNSKKRK